MEGGTMFARFQDTCKEFVKRFETIGCGKFIISASSIVNYHPFKRGRQFLAELFYLKRCRKLGSNYSPSDKESKMFYTCLAIHL